MSLKIKTPLRLKALFTGVALSKKSIDAISDQLAKAGLTDEATDEEIDTKLNERNALFSFDDQKKFDDYQAGKAAKEAADKEAARLKAIADGKAEETVVVIDPAETPMEKMIREMATGIKALTTEIANIKGQTVTQTRRESFIASMKGTTPEYQARELKRFDRITFKDDEDFTSYLEDTKDDHAAAVQEASNEQLGGDRPTGGAGAKPAGAEKQKVAATEVVDEIINAI
jgi:hypothetical protein